MYFFISEDYNFVSFLYQILSYFYARFHTKFRTIVNLFVFYFLDIVSSKWYVKGLLWISFATLALTYGLFPYLIRYMNFVNDISKIFAFSESGNILQDNWLSEAQDWKE